jgi:signal transduction histidine kinase
MKPGTPPRIKGGGGRFAQLGLPLLVLAFGFGSMLLLAITTRWHRRQAEQDTALVQAFGELESHAAVAHLWLEEHVTGDRVDLGEIDRRLERSADLCATLVGEKPPPADLPDLRAPEEPELRQEVSRLAASLAEYRLISADRLLGYRRGLEVGIGSDFDQEFDRIFRNLLGHLQVLEERAGELRRRHAQRDERAFFVITGAWSLFFLALAFGLFTYARHRRQVEASLEQSERRLERAQKLEAVGRLAGGLAHDLNNFLAAIRSQSELLLRKSPDPGTRTKMEVVIGTVDKASMLIERLLAFARQKPARREPVSLNSQVESLLPVLQPGFGEAVLLEKDLDPELETVFADPAQLEQVLLNLLVNAKDALGENGGKVKVETRNLPGDRVLLAVEDDGSGIPPELLDRIFEPFFSTKGGGSHSGLGLASVYGIVEQCGGTIEVKSEVGKGSRFEVTLPRHLAFIEDEITSS